MAGKITELTALTGAAAATTDVIETVDVSDTSMAATGTNKKMTLAELVTFLNANGVGGGSAPVGTKMSALTALTGAAAATGDILEVVDVSDTTMAASGTNKKMTLVELLNFLSAAGLVSDSGDTMTGGLTLRPASGGINLTVDRAAGQSAGVVYQTASLTRWALQVNNVGEGGGNAGSDLAIGRYNDAGSWIADALNIARSTGIITSAAVIIHPDGTAATHSATKGQMDTQLALKAPVRRTVINNSTTTLAPVVATHENTMVTMSNASAQVITLPSDATSNFPIGSEIDFLWLGVGAVSFAQGSSAVIDSSATNVTAPVMRIRYSAATAKKIAANTWAVVGDLA